MTDDELERKVAYAWRGVPVAPGAFERSRERMAQARAAAAGPASPPRRDSLTRRRIGVAFAGVAAATAIALATLLGAADRLTATEVVARAEAALAPQPGLVLTRAELDVFGARRLRGRVEAVTDDRGRRSHVVVRARDGRLATDIALRPGRVDAYTASDDTITTTLVPRSEAAVPPAFAGAPLTPQSLRGRLGGAGLEGPMRRGNRQVYRLTTVMGIGYDVDAETFAPVAVETAGGEGRAVLEIVEFRGLDAGQASRLDLLPHPGARRVVNR